MRRRYMYGKISYHNMCACDYVCSLGYPDQSVPGVMGGGVSGDVGMGVSEPGTLGQMDSVQETYSYSAGPESFEDEAPLLDELGIDFQLIKQKVPMALGLHVELEYTIQCIDDG